MPPVARPTQGKLGVDFTPSYAGETLELARRREARLEEAQQLEKIRMNRELLLKMRGAVRAAEESGDAAGAKHWKNAVREFEGQLLSQGSKEFAEAIFQEPVARRKIKIREDDFLENVPRPRKPPAEAPVRDHLDYLQREEEWNIARLRYTLGKDFVQKPRRTFTFGDYTRIVGPNGASVDVPTESLTAVERWKGKYTPGEVVRALANGGWGEDQHKGTLSYYDPEKGTNVTEAVTRATNIITGEVAYDRVPLGSSGKPVSLLGGKGGVEKPPPKPAEYMTRALLALSSGDAKEVKKDPFARRVVSMAKNLKEDRPELTPKQLTSELQRRMGRIFGGGWRVGFLAPVDVEDPILSPPNLYALGDNEDIFVSAFYAPGEVTMLTGEGDPVKVYFDPERQLYYTAKGQLFARSQEEAQRVIGKMNPRAKAEARAKAKELGRKIQRKQGTPARLKTARKFLDLMDGGM